MKNIGLVIGTYGSVPYIHLSLACLRKHEPDIKILIQDDYSEYSIELKNICIKYDAELYTTKTRLGWFLGDMSAVFNACEWSYTKGCDIGIKLSRRFIINKKFTENLIEIFNNTEAITLSGSCINAGFGFRSECIAFNTKIWHGSSELHAIKTNIDMQDNNIGLPEKWYHDKVKSLYESQASYNRLEYDKLYPSFNCCSGFVYWPLLGLGRCIKVDNILWHTANNINEYLILSQQYNLPYNLEDFKKI